MKKVVETIEGVPMEGEPDVLAELKEEVARQRRAVELAGPALARLVEVMWNKTGQGYKLRALLFSMWNGKPADLNSVCDLDHELRLDLGHVIAAWGYGRDEWEFFYNAMKRAITTAGLWDWFLEESETKPSWPHGKT